MSAAADGAPVAQGEGGAKERERRDPNRCSLHPGRCSRHPERPADQRCARCGRFHCEACLGVCGEALLCPACRRARRGRRLRVGAVVALMVGLPAVVIAWGLWRKLETGPNPGGSADDGRRSRAGSAGERRRGPRGAATQKRRMRQARALVKAGRIAQARQRLQRVLRRAPEHPGALQLLARLARRERQPRELLRLTTRLLRRAPGAQTARLWQAEAFDRLDHPTRAEATLREGLRVAPRAARLALALAARLERQQRLREAVELLHGVLQRGPDRLHQRLQQTLSRLEARLPVAAPRP